MQTETSVISKRKTFINSAWIFSKAQVSAFVGGMVDYGVMVFLTEIFGIHYTLTIVAGGIVGAFVNFFINRQWTFFSTKHAYKSIVRIQILKFVLMVINSFTLKSLGTHLFVGLSGIDYKIIRILVDLVVSLGCNYPLQKYWVFKKVKNKPNEQ